MRIVWRTIVPGVLFLSMVSARADLALVARYDWMDGAKDVSGSPVPHDGVLDPGVTAENGELRVFNCYGVYIGDVEEFNSATQVLLRFEDLTITNLPAGATGRYSALAGGGRMDYGIQWWVAVVFDLPPYANWTRLKFNVGGWDWYGQGVVQEVEVVVAEKVVTHFDSLEYRFDGSAPSTERIGFRWNDGPWFTAGWSDPAAFPVFPADGDIHINYGCHADWDALDATLGPVSFYAGSAAAGSLQRPGDENGDGILDLSDAVTLLDHLFLDLGSALPCGVKHELNEAGNIALLDSNGDGGIDISDVVHALTFLYLGGPPPALGTACVPIPMCPDTCR